MGAFVIVGYLLYMGVVYAVSKVFVWWVTGRKLKIFYKYFFPLILAILPFSELIASNIAQKMLCAREGGVHVVSSPTPDVGMILTYSRGCEQICIDFLLSGSVAYIENEIRTFTLNLMTSKTGRFRYYISTKDDPNCDAFYQEMEMGPSLFASKFVSNEKCQAYQYISVNTAPLRRESRRGIQKIGIFSFEYLDQMLVENGDMLLAYQRRFLGYAGFSTYLFHPFQARLCKQASDRNWWIQQLQIWHEDNNKNAS
ncbi:MAG: hypothetical protein V7723_15490 [Sneathiella sp.]|uniref:hypothetical protein n=1 Tax=Sneathiella sp. TaxID=1964365 RepID=UPI00300308A9